VLPGETLSARTSFSNDFDDWDVYGKYPTDLQLPFKIATLFVPIITGVLIQNEIIIP